MREDYAEQLNKMFPKGYVIMWIQPSTDPAITAFNPLQDEFVDNYLIATLDMVDGE